MALPVCRWPAPAQPAAPQKEYNSHEHIVKLSRSSSSSKCAVVDHPAPRPHRSPVAPWRTCRLSPAKSYKGAVPSTSPGPSPPCPAPNAPPAAPVHDPHGQNVPPQPTTSPPESATDAEAVRRGLAGVARLVDAWARVASHLAPDTQLDPAGGVAAAAAPVHQQNHQQQLPHQQQQPHPSGAEAAAPPTGVGGGMSGGWPLPEAPALVPPLSPTSPGPLEPPAGLGLSTGQHYQAGESQHTVAHAGGSHAPGQGQQGTALVGASPTHPTATAVEQAAALAGSTPPVQAHQQTGADGGGVCHSGGGQGLAPHPQPPVTQLAPAHLPAARVPQATHAHPHQLQHHQQQQQQQQHQQQQHQHFEAIITALKLALSSLQAAPPRRDGRSPAARAVQLASTLAELVAAGLPLDAAALCGGVVAEAAELGLLRLDVIRAQLGDSVAALVVDMLRVRGAPRRIELLDDEGASAVREWCLAFHDVRACVVEVVGWWDELQHMGGLPLFEQQALALEVLQIGAPLGHALGLGPLSAMMEDSCLKVLFPDSYASTSRWLRGLLDPAEDALFAAQQRLLSELATNLDFGQLAGGLVVKARTKSLFSVMKKLLALGDMARGGRSRQELYDLLGMRAIVQPLAHLAPEEAEAAAAKACYVVQQVASDLWRPIPERSKDYICTPKANGYQSIHLTLQLGQLDMSYSEPYSFTSPPYSSSSAASSYDSAGTFGTYGMSGSGFTSPESSSDFLDSAEYGGASSGSTAAGRRASGAAAAVAAEAAAAAGALCMELQIRTAAMDRAAESGDAAHAVYKGGLDLSTARQLQAWTQELRQRLASQPRGRLLLRAASVGGGGGGLAEDPVAAEERRRRRRQRRAAAAAAAAAARAAAAAAAAVAAADPLAALAPAAVAKKAAAVAGVDAVPPVFDPKTAGTEVQVELTLPGGAKRMAQQQQQKGQPRRGAAGGSSSAGPLPALLPAPVRRLPNATGTVAAATTSTSPQAYSATQLPTVSRSHGATAPTAPTASPAAATVVPGPTAPAASAPPATGGGNGAPGSSSPHDSPPTQSPPLSAIVATSHAPPPGHTGSPPATPSAAAAPPSPSPGTSPTLPPSSSLLASSAFLFNSLGSLDDLEDSLDQEAGPGEGPEGRAAEAGREGRQGSGSGGGAGAGAIQIGMAHQDAAAAAAQLFRHLDINGDGRLSLGEMRQVLADLAVPSSERDAAALVAALDANGDGAVSLDEFVQGVRTAQGQGAVQQGGHGSGAGTEQGRGQGGGGDAGAAVGRADVDQQQQQQQQQMFARY